jgi:hypothetical protein
MNRFNELDFYSVLCHIEIEGHILNTSTNSYIKMANHEQWKKVKST